MSDAVVDRDSQEIRNAQDVLSKTLDRARAGEDRALASIVRETGEQVARLLAGIFRLTRIHDLKNDAYIIPIRDLVKALSTLSDLLGSIHMLVVEDQIYVNDIRVRFDLHSDVPRELGQLWGRHVVGGISFHAAIDATQIKILLAEVALGTPDPRNPRAALQGFLIRNGMNGIELLPPFRFQLHGQKKKQVKHDVREIYKRSVGVLNEAWDNLASGRSPNALPIRRMVTHIVEADFGEQVDDMLAASRDKKNSPFSRHSMQVSSLSVMIGREIGMAEGALSDLGVAACFHDSGYTNEEDGYAPPFERHGSAGVRLLLKQRGFHEARILRLLVCLQHHSDYDEEPRPSLFARIIRIADDYDTLTRFRSDGPLMAQPDAMAYMYASRGTLYDPHLLQLFINKLGRYPPGSILELINGAWVIVVSGVRKPRLFAKPLTLMVRTRDGQITQKRIEIDLARIGRIRKVIRPEDEVEVDEEEEEEEEEFEYEEEEEEEEEYEEDEDTE